jgi:hypothetical protein
MKSKVSRLTFLLLSVVVGAQTGGERTVVFEPVLGLTFIHASVNGSRPLQMVLDTGASYTVLKPQIAAELGLKASGENLQAGGVAQGADQTLHLVKGVSLEFASEKLVDQTISTLPVDYIDREAGHPTDGILGGNIFASFVVHEDYAARTVTLIRPEEFTAPDGFSPVPLQVAGTVSLLKLQLQNLGGEKFDGTFLLDSGMASANLFFMKPFVDAHPGLKSGKLLALPPVTAVGGEVRLTEGRLGSLTVGPFVLPKPVAVYQDATVAGHESTLLAGIVGTGVLRRFDVIFDYPHSKLWLKPNAEFSKPFFGLASGLQLEVTPPEFARVKVRAVVAGSPGDLAGVQAGDIIVAVSTQRLAAATKTGEVPPPMTLSQVRDRLETPGQNIYLRLERNGKPLSIHFTTKQLV